jgi:hypothetical protein
MESAPPVPSVASQKAAEVSEKVVAILERPGGIAEERLAEPQSIMGGPQHLPDDDIVTQQAVTQIEASSDRDDQSDAGYASNSETGSTSISSSVSKYNFENGRRYHKFHEGTYSFPNDESEQDREDMKHAMIVYLCDGRLFYSPLKHPQNIIDLGTGTGIWAIDSNLILLLSRTTDLQLLTTLCSGGSIPKYFGIRH